MGVIDPSMEDPCLYMTCPPPATWCGEIIPEGLCDHVEIFEDDELLFSFNIIKEISNADFIANSGQTLEILGKKVADSSVTARSFRGDRDAIIGLATTQFNTTDIVFKGSGDGLLAVIAGRFNDNSITFKKKSADLVVFDDDVLINNATINAGGGTDTITFMENSVIRGTNEITFGPGKDVLELPANKRGNGKIVVTDLAGNDTIKIGEQSFSGRDILKGKIDLPKYVQLKFKR